MNNEQRTLANEETHAVAFTILEQLGGKVFKLMSGSYNFSAGKNGLSMTLQKNKLNAKFLCIVYDEGRDLYDMIFLSSIKQGTKVLKRYDGVFWDQLQDIFEAETGFIVKVRITDL